MGRLTFRSYDLVICVLMKRGSEVSYSTFSVELHLTQRVTVIVEVIELLHVVQLNMMFDILFVSII